MANDIFANIAANGIGGRMDQLCEIVPKKHEAAVCKLTDSKEAPIKTVPKMSTKAELYEALEKMKAAYKPFLADYAPKTESKRKRIYIKEFLLDGKEKINIPHYGGPVGYAKKVYESEFELDDFSGKAVYITFKGADYYAVVYINGVCVGTHEGFFSPFEFDITENAKKGKNSLKVELYNDNIYMGNAFATQEKTEGEKLYAATGLGWDDAAEGWHHCPAGMGIYNDVFVEVRETLNITDLYVRPMADEEKAEVWVEVESALYDTRTISIELNIFGQNFKEDTLIGYEYIPETVKTVGMGDSLTEASVKDVLGKGIPLPVKKGKNIFKIMVDIKNPKIWELDKPYLYQVQASVKCDGAVMDTQTQQFGMRTFIQDTENTPKGMFYLNGRKIRLRGANTMGFEQQDVMNHDIDQLIDDILLAKLCNMNFLRLTQRPVQDEIYEYCDKLGLMTQSDLPLFGCMRRTKFCEGLRQVEEMEKMVRKHPCNVVVSYINEPFPNANNEPHRHLNREELEQFFTASDIVIKLQNPDRVIKHVDGDYDPPTESMPDNHCYPMWYNGHGIDIGRLHKGYWLNVRPDWYYGCGEYGAEGLDFEDVMTECYPKSWTAEPFNPSNIVRAQTGDFHYFFYDTQDNMSDWVKESHAFQAFATSIMTEAFRRDDNMISNAIHLFIDAWPSGWMKTIMDCRRNPKPAFFAYRNSLEPVMLSLRTDRFTYFAGEEISIECHICNDTNISGDDFTIHYELYSGDKLIKTASQKAKISDCAAGYAGEVNFSIDSVSDREKFTVKAILTDKDGNVITHNSLGIEVFEDVEIPENDNVVLIEKLDAGEYEIAGENVEVKECGMLPLHFVSRKTGHKAVAEFEKKDFSYWYDKSADMITPILYATFTADGFTPILTSGNMDANGDWGKVLACAVKEYEGKKYVICQVDLRCENPVAKRFLKNIMEL